MRTLLTSCVVLIATGAAATNYFVAVSGTDTNTGLSEAAAWGSLTNAAARMYAGDVCYAGPGLYDQRVTTKRAGTAAAPITFAAETNAICRGFYVQHDYTRVEGFEITQGVANVYSGILISGADGCQVLNNYLHHTTYIGIELQKAAPADNTIIRGNRLAYIGVSPTNAVGECAINMAGHYNLVEYNDISHVGDFLNGWGNCNIVRNNYLHDVYTNDFPQTAAGALHVDGLQYYQSSLLMTRWLVEENYIENNLSPDSHVLLLRDSGATNSGSSDVIYRHNVAVSNGSYALTIQQFSRAMAYNNTFADMMCMAAPQPMYCFTFTTAASNAVILNNIFYRSSRTNLSTIYSFDASSLSNSVYDYSLNWMSGPGTAEDHRITNCYPAFVDGAADVHLASTSAAVDSAGPLTACTDGGTNGTTLTVANAALFSDGWGIANGDSIRVATNAATAVTAVDYTNNTVTVGDAISWSPGDEIRLEYSGTNSDRGAYEYTAANWCDIALTSPVATDVSDPLVIGVAVTNPAEIRMVEFFVDGRGVGTTSAAPYTCNWASPGADGRSHTITAVGYARHASKTPRQSVSVEYTYPGPFVVLGGYGGAQTNWIGITNWAVYDATTRVAQFGYGSAGGGGPAQKATGGMITTNGNYIVHDVTVSDAIIPLAGSLEDCDVIWLGGGGKGGNGFAGNFNGAGGGAGGLIVSNHVTITGSNWVQIGAGATETNGGDTIAFGTTAKGGGAGGTGNNVAPAAGGSGGGGCGGSATAGAAGTAGQGNAGGAGTTASPWRGGGGGGFNGEGATGAASGDGGVGYDASWIFGAATNSYQWAGGGGGAPSTGYGSPGNGTFGAGDGGSNSVGQAGTANTGGGGGGGDETANHEGGIGGSGRVVVRYKGI